ncbi:serine/threonine-protein kinase [Nocardia sp. CDC153]|uniref:serine/threonine-protein kinase n=1 Tax=Nocardia sp. CDC153 TaxID=3112167 RepID=UPI002DB9BED6|nr:serine/threonine-protein kinase [Nocardia sp. CDC153]MEC3953764.1 serine/threonine-protein kinase [Nocardia sp. CDC153]
MAQDQLLRPGTVFAGYRIERILGRGGMGTVYLVRHPRLPRFEALKVLPAEYSDDPEYRARFGREAELAARLSHPNIVAVRDRGETDGCLWIAMQFVDGFDAATLIRRHRDGVPPNQALHIVEQAARGLDEAHRAGMLHRDVKPANLLLEARPDQPERVYVSDFGIARGLAGATPLTQDGSVLATIAYAAPEQLSAEALDPRVDIYALGGTLYELLTGAKPFPHENAAAVMQAHLMEPPPRPSVVNPALPPAIDEVIARSMAKRPSDRYPSCGELARAAALALDPPGGVVSTATVRIGSRKPRLSRSNPARRQPNTRRWYRRRWFLAGAAGTVLAAILAGTMVLNQDSGTSARTTAPTSVSAAPTSAVPSSSGSPIAWGTYQFAVQAFPTLLPASPIASGYQGLRCHPVTADGDRLTLTDPLGATAELECEGNRNPVSMIAVSCRVNHTPRDMPSPDPETTVLRTEPWQRTSGHGQIRVSSGTESGRGPHNGPYGFLQVQFDDVARNFCLLGVWGGTSGDDLFDRWWRDAPL